MPTSPIPFARRLAGLGRSRYAFPLRGPSRPRTGAPPHATVAAAGGEFSCVIDGLTEDTTYHFFVVAEDSSDAELMSGRAREGEENLVADADVEVVEMKTKDVTPPSYTNAPAVKAGSMDSSGVTFTLETTVSEAGKGYYVVLARDATAPRGVFSDRASNELATGRIKKNPLWRTLSTVKGRGWI